MKKIYLLITIICIFTLTGCGSKEVKKEETKTVNDYVSNAKKKTWVDVGVSYLKSAVNKVNEGGRLALFSSDILYIIPVGNGKSCVKVEYEVESPFSNTWKYAYVVAVYDGAGYEYYYIAEDGAGYGVNLLTRKELMDNGTEFMYLNSNRDSKDFGDYLTQKYNINENDLHELTNLEKSAYQKILSKYSNIRKVVYISGESNCKYQA